jgi:hypothetical protein
VCGSVKKIKGLRSVNGLQPPGCSKGALVWRFVSRFGTDSTDQLTQCDYLIIVLSLFVPAQEQRKGDLNATRP